MIRLRVSITDAVLQLLPSNSLSYEERDDVRMEPS